MRMFMLCLIMLVFSACSSQIQYPRLESNSKQTLLTQSPRTQNSAQSPRQVSPDAPKDTPIAVRVQGNAKWCMLRSFQPLRKIILI